MYYKMAQKQCSRCKDIKPISEFYNQPNSKDGLKYSCKKCCNERGRIYLDYINSMAYYNIMMGRDCPGQL